MILIDTDPAVFSKSQAAVDRVTHLRRSKDADPPTRLARVVKRRQRNGGASAPPSGPFDRKDEVDSGDARSEEQRRGRNRLPTQPSQVVAPRQIVAQADTSVHLAYPFRLGRTLAEARCERVSPRRQAPLVADPLDREALRETQEIGRAHV